MQLTPEQIHIRHTRFRIALILAGPGSGPRLAAKLGVSYHSMLHVMRGRRNAAGKLSRNYKMEDACELFTMVQFHAHRHILNIETFKT